MTEKKTRYYRVVGIIRMSTWVKIDNDEELPADKALREGGWEFCYEAPTDMDDIEEVTEVEREDYGGFDYGGNGVSDD